MKDSYSWSPVRLESGGLKLGQERCLRSRVLILEIRNPVRLRSGALRRPAAGTAAGGATVAGRKHRDGTRPATGHITHRLRSKHATPNPIENSAAPPL
ncbi:hypothetical protein ACLOJK_027535 [Asimina triloba]